MAAPKNFRKKRSYRLIFRLFPFSSLILILLGIGLIFLSVYNSTLVQSESTRVQESGTQRESIYPVQLYIPKLSKILEIEDGKVVDNRWTISASGVSYLTTSAMPGEGNTVI